MDVTEVNGYYLLPNKKNINDIPIEKKVLYNYLVLRLFECSNNNYINVEDAANALLLGYNSTNKFVLSTMFQEFIPENYKSVFNIYNHIIE